MSSISSPSIEQLRAKLDSERKRHTQRRMQKKVEKSPRLSQQELMLRQQLQEALHLVKNIGGEENVPKELMGMVADHEKHHPCTDTEPSSSSTGDDHDDSSASTGSSEDSSRSSYSDDSPGALHPVSLNTPADDASKLSEQLARIRAMSQKVAELQSSIATPPIDIEGLPSMQLDSLQQRQEEISLSLQRKEAAVLESAAARSRRVGDATAAAAPTNRSLSLPDFSMPPPHPSMGTAASFGMSMTLPPSRELESSPQERAVFVEQAHGLSLPGLSLRASSPPSPPPPQPEMIPSADPNLLKDFEARIAATEEALASLHTTVQASEERSVEENQDRTDLISSRFQQLEEHLQEADKATETLRGEQARAQSQVRKLAEVLAAKIQELENKTIESDEAVEGQGQQVQQQAAKMEEMQSNLESVVDDTVKALKRMDALDDVVDKLTQASKAIRSDSKNVKDGLVEEKEKNQQLETAFQDLRQKLDHLVQEQQKPPPPPVVPEEVKAKQDEFQKHVQGLTTKIQGMENSLQALVEEEQKRDAATAAAVAAGDKTSQAQKEEMNALQSRLAEMEEQLQALVQSTQTSQLQAAEATKVSANAQAKVTNEAQRAEAARAEAVRAHEAAKAEAQAAKAQAEAAREQVAQAQAAIAEAQAVQADAAKAQTALAQAQSIKAQAAKAEADAAKAQAEAAKAEADAAKAQAEAAKAEAEAAKVEAEAAKLEAEQAARESEKVVARNNRERVDAPQVMNKEPVSSKRAPPPTMGADEFRTSLMDLAENFLAKLPPSAVQSGSVLKSVHANLALMTELKGKANQASTAEGDNESSQEAEPSSVEAEPASVEAPEMIEEQEESVPEESTEETEAAIEEKEDAPAVTTDISTEKADSETHETEPASEMTELSVSERVDDKMAADESTNESTKAEVETVTDDTKENSSSEEVGTRAVAAAALETEIKEETKEHVEEGVNTAAKSRDLVFEEPAVSAVETTQGGLSQRSKRMVIVLLTLIVVLIAAIAYLETEADAGMAFAEDEVTGEEAYPVFQSDDSESDIGSIPDLDEVVGATLDEVDEATAETAPVEAEVEESKVEELEVEEAKVEEAVVEEAKVEEAAVEEAQVEEATVEEAQVEEATVEEAQVEEAQVEEAQVEEAQVEDAQVEEPQVEEAQVEEATVEEPQVSKEEDVVEDETAEVTDLMEETISTEDPVEKAEVDVENMDVVASDKPVAARTVPTFARSIPQVDDDQCPDIPFELYGITPPSEAVEDCRGGGGGGEGQPWWKGVHHGAKKLHAGAHEKVKAAISDRGELGKKARTAARKAVHSAFADHLDSATI